MGKESKPNIYDLVNLERRIDPLTKEESDKLTYRQLREANGIILQNKYKAFAREYVRTGNARTSALTVGYSSRHGYKLLANEDVLGYIKEISELATTGEIASAQETLLHLSEIIRGDAMDYAYTKDGDVIEIPTQVKDKVKAIDIMTKCHGLQQNTVNMKGTVTNINVTADIEQPEFIYEIDPSDIEIIDLEEMEGL